MRIPSAITKKLVCKMIVLQLLHQFFLAAIKPLLLITRYRLALRMVLVISSALSGEVLRKIGVVAQSLDFCDFEGVSDHFLFLLSVYFTLFIVQTSVFKKKSARSV